MGAPGLYYNNIYGYFQHVVLSHVLVMQVCKQTKTAQEPILPVNDKTIYNTLYVRKTYALT